MERKMDLKIDIKEDSCFTKSYYKNWQENLNTYQDLICLFHELNSDDYNEIILDFSGVEFISANVFSAFGSVIEWIVEKYHPQLYVMNLHPKILDVMRKNGFAKYFGLDLKNDDTHNAIEYKKFEPSTNGLEEFEKYVLMNIFQMSRLPIMDENVKDKMIDNILEMFNNVIDHAECENVFVCGQFFPKKQKVVFTITDLGKTIKENVEEYAYRKGMYIENPLGWALEQGNSTKETNTPGGLGFSLLLDFLELNKGEFTLISDNQCFQLDSKRRRRYKEMKMPFPGTIVTITINLNDDYEYHLSDMKDATITF